MNKEDSLDEFLNRPVKKKQTAPADETAPARLNKVKKELEKTLDFTEELEDFTPERFKEIQKDFTFTELDFINEYLNNGYVGYKAYMKVNKQSNYINAQQQSRRILSKESVKRFLQLFRNAQAERFQITLQSQLVEIEELIEACKSNPDLQDRTNWLKALIEKGKLAGLYAPEQDVKSNRAIEIYLDLEPKDVKTSKPIDITENTEGQNLLDSE